jgi:hypothetical protein
VQRVEVKPSTLAMEPELARGPRQELSETWSREFGEKVQGLSRSVPRQELKVPHLAVENIKVLGLSARRREMFRPAPAITPPVKAIDKGLELTLKRDFGKGLSR